jgi:alkylation response protein AidB-like acyl-CoA dehydrogenase
MLGYVGDEAVQIHGGYGYIEEYQVERTYRDNRIFRIVEGTNEINRVITVGFLMRKALKNEIPLLAAIEKLKGELPGMKPVSVHVHGGPLSYEHALVERAKKVLLLVAGAAVGKYGEAVSEEQEILGRISDIAAEAFAMESGLLRAVKAIEVSGKEASSLKVDMVRVYVNEAMCRVYEHAAGALAAVHSGKELTEQIDALYNMTHVSPINTIALRRGIADRVIAAEKYVC